MGGWQTMHGKLFPITLIALASALGVTGCGTVQATSEARVRAQDTSGPAPIDAALVTPGFGWVLTADRLLVTRDGGVTFSDAKAPVPVTAARAAFFSRRADRVRDGVHRQRRHDRPYQ